MHHAINSKSTPTASTIQNIWDIPGPTAHLPRKFQLSDESHWLKNNPNDEVSREECKRIEEKIQFYKKYAAENKAYVFDLNIPYGAEDVIDQLRSILPDFHVLKSEEE